MMPQLRARARELIAAGIVRVYLGGPMTRVPFFNVPLFDSAATNLRAVGFEVISPAELDGEEIRRLMLANPEGDLARLEAESDESYNVWLGRDIHLLTRPDDPIHGMVALPGWTRSTGANWEAGTMKSLHRPVLTYPGLNPVRHEPRLPYQRREED